MKTYIVEIGTINSQNRYKVIAPTPKEAKRKAVQRHKDHGWSLDLTKDSVWATRIR